MVKQLSLYDDYASSQDILIILPNLMEFFGQAENAVFKKVEKFW